MITMGVHLSTLDKKINQTKEYIQYLEQELKDNNNDIAIQINLDSVKDRLKELEEERLRMQDLYEENMELRIQGETVEKGKISARVLADVLTAFQSLTDSIANNIGNRDTSRGTIPATIREAVELKVTGVFAGSFGVKLQGNTVEPNLLEKPLLTQSMEKLFNLLSCETNPEKIMDVAPEVGQRSLTNYKEMVSLLSRYNIGIGVNWKSPLKGRYTWSLKSEIAPDLIKTLENIVEEEAKEVTFSGKLTALNFRKETFEFLVYDETRTILQGNIDPNIIKKSKQFLDEDCQVDIKEVVTKNLSTGQEKSSWTLINVREPK